MSTALLFDVHGNLPALEAVVADARARGTTRWLLGGDYALFGGRPAECLAVLRELKPAAWIRGNGERWTATPAEAPGDEVVQGAIAACRGVLGDAVVGDLAALPVELREPGLQLVHGSPDSDVRSFFPEPADDEDELLADVAEPRLVFGHTHLPFRRVAATGVELVNPGSVGMPFDGDPRAAYAVLHPDGRVEHRRVAYDRDPAVRAIRELGEGTPWARAVAARVEQARFVAP